MHEQEYSVNTICNEVRSAIGESLDIEENEISLSSNIVRDLDGESIDFLDIVFRLESKFKIKIERGQLERTLRERFPDQNIKPNSEISPNLREALFELLPEVEKGEVEQVKKVKEITSLFTVATFVRFTVKSLRESRPSAVLVGDVVDGFTPMQLGFAS